MPHKETKTFLLVEDDPNDAYLVEIEFRKSSHLQLRHVADGQHAADYLEGNPPYTNRSRFPMPDVILLDLKMPRVGGFELLEWLRNDSSQHLRRIPVIVMSGSNLEKDVNRAYELGANCYLTKPPDWDTFREQMERIGIFWGEVATLPPCRNANAQVNPHRQISRRAWDLVP
jgi:CheY-like chemotaxis protein